MFKICLKASMALFVFNSVCILQARAASWPEVFDPAVLLTLNLEMDPTHWQQVVNDMSVFDENLDEVKRPAYFWADGEEDQKIYVSVRRKSGDPISPAFGPDGTKVSLKIDINKYHIDDPTDPDFPGHPDSVEMWHGIKKLSLENGDDNNVITEGIACNLHQMASGPEGYGYDPWRGNWVRLIVNGHDYGVYFNAEHLDKTFLKNRNFYVWHESWLYQYRGAYSFSLEIGDDLNPKSPAVNALCCRPFRNESDPALKPDTYCDLPTGTELVNYLDTWIDMQGMLAMAAVNAFVSNPDSLFTHERNSHFLDFSLADGRKRMYLPWDVDGANFHTNTTIYGSSTGYQQMIFGNPELKERYRRIMCNLVNGPLSESALLAFIDRIEPVLTPQLVTDPYNKLGTNTAQGIADYFDDLRRKLVNRIANVRTQAECADCSNSANLDGIGIVDLADLAILASDWNLTGQYLAGDIDKNETVNIADLLQIAQNWLSGSCQ